MSSEWVCIKSTSKNVSFNWMTTLKCLLVLLILIPVIGLSQSSFKLLDEYNFLQHDGKIFQLTQSHDTLYEVRKSVFGETFTDPRKHFKIHGFIEISNYQLLKVERLDTISLTTDPFPITRYSVIAIRSMNEKQLGYLPIMGSLTKVQMDSFSIQVDSLTNKFFYTYFSRNYMGEFPSLKEIVTKKDANKILRLAKSKKFNDVVKSWSATNIGDYYGTILLAELLTMACLDLGYNPITADLKITALKKKL